MRSTFVKFYTTFFRRNCSKMSLKTVKLNSGFEMPIVGLGTWQSKPGEVKSAIIHAVNCGYRHIDCAYCYGNEAEVGDALSQLIAKGTVKREDLFITSKLWNTFHRPDLVEGALRSSLKSLKLDYLDLYLIHWPHSFKEDTSENFPRDAEGNILYSDVEYVDTWKAMEQCVHKGLVRSIGVSNFNSQQIQDVIDQGKIKPANLQVELHPYFNQGRLVKFCKERDVSVTAYSPLASGSRPWIDPNEPVALKDPRILEIAAKLGKSAAQVMLRWLIQREIIVIPKSITPTRIEENYKLFDFSLTSEDMEAMNNLNRDQRLLVPRVEIDGKLVARDRQHKFFPFHLPF